MFRFLIENNLISSNQSGFKPGDSCINQLLSITHEIYKSFDDGFEMTSLFSIIHDVETSVNDLNNELYQINKWAFQWK